MLIALVCFAGSNSVAQIVYTPVIQKGDQVPGLTDGTVIRGVSQPVINRSGQVAFHASVAKPILLPNFFDQPADAILGPSDNGLALIAKVGEPVPGTDDNFNYWRLNDEPPALNDLGQVAFDAILFDQQELHRAVLGPTALGLRPIGIRGEQVPGLASGIKYNSFDPPLLNNQGLTAFGARLQSDPMLGVDDTNASVLLAPTASGIRVVARAKEPAFGAEATPVYSFFRNTLLTDSGTLIGQAFIRDTPEIPNIANGAVVFQTQQDELINIASTNAPFQPLASQEEFTFLSFRYVGANEKGEVAFAAETRSSSINMSDRVLFGPTENGLGLILREGDRVPDREEAAFFTGFGDPSISNEGHLVFAAYFDEQLNSIQPSHGALFLRDQSGITKIAQRGDPLPSATDEATIGVLGNTMVNDRGDIVFDARIKLPGQASRSEDRVILAYSSALEELLLIARGGQEIDVDPGPGEDLRTIAAVEPLRESFSLGNSPHRNIFNNAGQLALAMGFTDGSSGIYIAQVPTLVPEPLNATLALIGILTLLSSRLRRR